MATMSNSESRRLYSWWWDSHITPKNSKWLQENLTDMDAKVKLMIKLIEEDADSFARRAEMYYKKRPELMKLVEEFYRAYRALAERYDYATGELRHAQRTMAAEFLEDSSLFTGTEPHLPELKEMFLEAKMKKDEKSNQHEYPDEAGCEIQNLEKALMDMLAEKESIFIEYQQSLDKFSNTDRELNCALEESKRLDEKAKKAEKEFRILKGALGVLQADSHAQEEAHKMNVETQNLMNKIDTLESKNEAGLLQCLDRVSVLEKKIIMIEEEAAKAGEEIEKLTTDLSESNERKEALRVLYEQCLEKIRKLELDLSSAQEEVKHLNGEILIRAQKIQTNEGNYVRLKMEVGDMAKKIMLKDEELCKKQNELEKLQNCVKEEHMRYVEVEATLQNLQNLHNRSQEEQRDLTIELKNCIQMLKDLEMSKDSLEEEMQKVKDENRSLNELNASSSVSMKTMETEIVGLRQRIENIKELTEKNNDLKKSLFDANCELEVSREKVEELQKSCQLIHGEKSTVLLEKTMLLCQLHVITVNMVKLMDKSSDLEKSLANANVELEGLREKSKGLEELCQLLNNEKSNLIAERSMVAFQNGSVEQRLEILEKQFMEFEERDDGLEKQNHFLEEESKWKKKEFQEELDRAVIAQFENFILQKFIEDIEERNYTLMVECEKHIEASKLADKLISELETENLEQQVEEELLVVEIENLRSGIFQVFGSECGFEDEDECEQISVDKILSKLKEIKCSLLKYEDDKLMLLVEKKVILTMLEQLELEVQKSNLDKAALGKMYEIIKNDYLEAMKEKLELVEINRSLMEEVHEGDDRESILKGEVESLHMKQGEIQRAYLVLQEEYSKILKENGILLKDFLKLKEDSRLIEEESNGIILETFLALDNISTIFRSCTAEKDREIRLLSEDLRNLHGYNNDLEKELLVLGEKLDLTQIENLLMQCTVEQLESKLKETENMNSELGLAMEEMMMKCGESKVKVETLEKETVEMAKNNANLIAKLGVLNEEIEGRKTIEENMASELQVRENEFELWGAEATSFYFDLQVSNVRDVLFENKVHELSGVCESLEGETASKDEDLEEMKEKVSIMESEIEGLRSELLAYTPVIGSLKESIASLEHKFVQANPVVSDNQKPKDVEIVFHPHHCHTNDSDLMEGPNTRIPNGVVDLMELQARIIAVEKAMVSSSTTSIKKKTSKGVTQELKSTEDHKRNNEKFRGKSKVEIYEAKKKVQIRDIPLDQASDGSSSMKMLPYEPQIEELGVDKLEIIAANRQEKQGIFSQKLASDAQKLSNLEEKVNNLMTKLETKSKKGRKRKAMGVDLETLKEQLVEIQENVLQLVNVIGELTEKNPSSVMEQEKASERITRLQLEVQKIQYVLLKLDDDDEIKSKKNGRFSRIILRGFIRHGKISSSGKRNKKTRFCGCLTPSTKGDSRSQR